MTDASGRWHDFDLLLGRILDGIETEEDVRRLNAILRADSDARNRYMTQVHLHGRLAWGRGVKIAGMDETTPAAARAPDHEMAHPARARMNGSLPATAMQSGIAPAVHRASFAAHYGSFVGGVPLAYVAIVAVYVAGLLAAWVWHDPGPGSTDVVKKVVAPVKHRELAPAGPQVAVVGRVIALNDCRWAHPAAAAADGDPVPVGRRIALSSGWVQIRYNTGAIVVIYGPAVYEVNSETTGFLAAGKASAQVESTFCQGRGYWDTAAIGPKVFAIQTANCRFNVLGAHCSVVVDASGATHAIVMSGLIEAVYPRASRVRELVSSPVKGWYVIKEDDPRGCVVLYRTGALPSGLWSSDDRRFGWSQGTLDLQQWRAQQRGMNPRPKSRLPN